MDSSEERAFFFAMELATSSALPMALQTALELNLLELIKGVGPEASISAIELAALLPTSNPSASTMIDRTLRLLAAHSILICHPKDRPDGSVDQRYSLAPVCKFLTKNEDGVSLAPYCIMAQDRIFMEPWYHLKDAILDGGLPFDRAHGTKLFEHMTTNPRLNEVFNLAMHDMTTIHMKKILENYKGFEGLTSLVDVGGGIGATLEMIIAKYPAIQGINFDLPHVLQDAPSYSGMKHVGGDMFVSIPKTDAIFMKWVIHDWDDEQCVILLKNCYDALPDNGKVIAADAIIGDEIGLKCTVGFDVIMLAAAPGGKERTEKEFQVDGRKENPHLRRLLVSKSNGLILYGYCIIFKIAEQDSKATLVYQC